MQPPQKWEIPYSESPEIQAKFEELTKGMTRQEAVDFVFSDDLKARDLLMMEAGYRRDQHIAPKG